MLDFIGSLANTGVSLMNNTQSQNNATANKNWDFANSRASQSVLDYYMKNGSLDNFNMFDNNVSGQDYNDVADYFNPILSLKSFDLNKKLQEQQMDLNERQFKTSQDIAYNGAQIKAEDYRKAGFNPLLAVGGTSSFSPVSQSASSVNSSPVPQTRSNSMPSFQGSSIGTNSDLLDYINQQAQARILNAQADKIEAETETEKKRPANLDADTDKKIAEINNIKTDTNYKLEQINSELEKQNLTKKQVEYYDSEMNKIIHDLELSKEFNVKSFETVPFHLNQLHQIFDTMGLSEDSPIYPYLMAASMVLIMYAGNKISNTSKFSKNITINNNGGK